jgi:hypothetical protein
VEQESHDDFGDLLDYVLNNAAEEGVFAKSSVVVPTRRHNPTLGELMDIPAR